MPLMQTYLLDPMLPATAAASRLCSCELGSVPLVVQSCVAHKLLFAVSPDALLRRLAQELPQSVCEHVGSSA